MSNTKSDPYNTSSNFNKLPYDVIQLMAGTSGIDGAKGFLSKKETRALALANTYIAVIMVY